jgi:hypothetical protein
MVCGDREGEGLPQKKARGRSGKLALTRLNESLEGKRYCIHRTLPLEIENLKSSDGHGFQNQGKCLEFEDVCSSDWKENSPRLKCL